MTIRECTFYLVGISDILMNNPISMQSGASPKMGKKKIPTPQEEAARSVYMNARGELQMPSIAFKSSLLRGTTGKRLGKVSAMSLFAAGVFEIDDYTVLLTPETGKPIKDYTVHVARCVVQRAGVMRARARVGPWKAAVRFEVDDDFVTEQQVAEIFQIAGRISGVGDWRPEKKGRFGRYALDNGSTIDGENGVDEDARERLLPKPKAKRKTKR